MKSTVSFLCVAALSFRLKLGGAHDGSPSWTGTHAPSQVPVKPSKPIVKPVTNAPVKPTVKPVLPTLQPVSGAPVQPTLQPVSGAPVQPTLQPVTDAPVQPTATPVSDAPVLTPVSDAPVQPTGQPTVQPTNKPTAPVKPSVPVNIVKINTTGVGCFSERTFVQVRGKGEVLLPHVKLGDWVMNGQGHYDKVYSWSHYDHKLSVEFLQLHLDAPDSERKHRSSIKTRGDGGHPLELSADHLLLVHQGKGGATFVPARSVLVGDLLQINNGTVQVRRINKVVRRGAYAPFTASGTMAVNQQKIVVSVYIDLLAAVGVVIEAADKSIPLAAITRLGPHWAAHLCQTPHRLYCRANWKACKGESYDNQGMSTIVAFALSLALWWLQQNHWIQLITSIPFWPFLAMMYAMEHVIDANIVVLLLTFAISYWLVSKSNTHKR